MTRASLFILCPRGVHAAQENFERTAALFDRLREIHPLFATVSPRAARSGRAAMEAQPIFPDVTFDQWQASYDAHRKAASRFGDAPTFGVRVPYWNRRAFDDGLQMIELQYDVATEWRENEVMLSDLASPLLEPEVLRAMIQAGVETFNACRADCAWLTEGPVPHFLYHMLWVREGTPFPQGAHAIAPGKPIPLVQMERYPVDHAPARQAEPWLGGTLYLWPDHDPLQLAAADSASGTG
jgi:hypothetical protein